MWDLCQPDTGKSRWWKGFGTGIAAGIKLTPLIFIPYLILARKFRQAAMACAGFAFTVLLGFVILPRDSTKWWFDGLFAQAKRTGFAGWAGNQSLNGLITRLAGSIDGGRTAWIAADVLVVAAGVVVAGLLDRKGYAMLGLLTAALTGLLVSPISWDHHWVWIVPGAVVAGHYAVQAWRRGAPKAAWAIGLLAVAIVADKLVPREPAQPRHRLARPGLDPEEHEPGLVPVVRRPALVPRVPLARVGPHHRQRLHPGRAGPLRAAASDVVARTGRTDR